MLFTSEFKAGIRAGRVTRTYRNWKKPQARPGRQYNLPPDGVIEVTGLSSVKPEEISEDDALAAGFTDAATLLTFLKITGPVYLVEFTYLGSGLVRQPEQTTLANPQLDELVEKLSRMDARAEALWTEQALRAIARAPGQRAADLAPAFGWDTTTLKRQVRKLKGLGLTQSLETGYEISARGRQLLDRLNANG